MATIPVHNPQSPFLGQIPGGLRVGSILKIRATIQGFSNRFQIYLQSGAALKPRDDVMLHISILPQENAIIRNSLQNQVWGNEERFGGNPIQANQSFEISIHVEAAHYRVSINNQHFCVFTHRLPLHKVQYVSVAGTCSIQYITITPDIPSVNPGPVYPIHNTSPFPKPHYQPPLPQHHHHHHHHTPPVPPPMPPPSAPPPYPGFYPGHTGHQQPAPYTKSSSSSTSLKVAAGLGAAVGLTAFTISKAAKDMKERKSRKEMERK